MRNMFKASAFATLALSFALTACNNAVKPAEAAGSLTSASTTTSANAASGLRGANAAAEYRYKTLASFKKGAANVDLAQLAALEGKDLSFVVLYESNAPWAEVFNTGNYSKTGSDKFNGLLDSYGLSITKQFELDDMNEGLVLEPSAPMKNATEAARELSLVDNVLMVEVKEVPKDVVNSSTAGN